MKAGVVVFPGSNCDRDVAVALRASTGRAPAMLWHGDDALPPLDLIVLPGGFSYGDYLRCGAMAAHSPIVRAIRAAAARGTPVIGICNGFQVLCEAGMLPGALIANAGLRFVCRDVHLRVETGQSLFTHGYATGQVLRMPVAHHDGQYVADDETLDALEDRGQIAFRYVTAPADAPSDSPDPGPANPNGSARDIAGIFNRQKTVLGLMPHPERAADPRHPSRDGRALFDGLVGALAA